MKKSSHKLNVLAIIKPERTSGADMMLLDAVRRLDPEKFQVTLGLLTEPPASSDLLPTDLSRIHFGMHQLNGVVWLRFFFCLGWYLWRRRIHILHVNSYVPGNYARAAAWLLRVPVIIDYWHGFTRFSGKRRWICRCLEHGTDLSLTVSEGVRQHLLEHLQLPSQKIKVLYNGIDLERLRQHRGRQEMRAALGLPVDGTVVGVVARLDHWGKGHGELFQALAQIHRSYPVHCLVIGGGRRQADMEALVQELGLRSWVHFLGDRDDVPDLLAALDIFVLPSHSEGVSRSLLEAMAGGLPVVVSDAGGSPEVVQSEVNGLLVPMKNIPALADALRRLLADPAWAAQLGAAAARRVADHFSLARLGRELNEIYTALANAKGLL